MSKYWVKESGVRELTQQLAALKEAIQGTLEAISDGRGQVEDIASRTIEEVALLEAEFEQVQHECAEAIAQVENLEIKSRESRTKLMEVNRDSDKHSEAEMKLAYEIAGRHQQELKQMQDRESYLRNQRDNIARRLKTLRATAHQAEVLLLKFGHVADVLNGQFESFDTMVQLAQMQSLLGLRLLHMIEDERRQLATELHDGPMQSLASISLGLYANGGTEETGTSEREVSIKLNNVITSLKRIVFDLRPPLLDDLGLVPTLKQYAATWSDIVQVPVQIHLIGLEARLTPTEKVSIFRTIQEALHNVAEHAQAQTVDIKLTYGVNKLMASVTDDGSGISDIDWMGWLEQGKTGLALSRQRLAVLSGTVDIEPNTPIGTRILITLPISRGSD